MSKRPRSINWDEEEKQLFRSVLKDYTHIIEAKTLTTNSNKLKMKAWEDIHQKFNSLNNRQRDLNQLKIQWKGMKILARKTYTAFKKESNKTGGGARPVTPDDVIIEIQDLLNPAELLTDQNIYDSDGMVGNQSSSKTNILVCDVADEESTLPALQEATITIKQIESDETNIQEQNEATVTKIQVDNDEEQNKSIHDSVVTPLGNRHTKTRKNTPRKMLQSRTLKLQKNHEDYVSNITLHSKELKDREHSRRMEMAEEKHALEMAILKRKLLTAQIEQEIAEEKLKKIKCLE